MRQQTENPHGESSLSVDPAALVKALQNGGDTTRKKALNHLRRLDVNTLGAVITRLVSTIQRLRMRSRIWLAVSIVAGLAALIDGETSPHGTPTFYVLNIGYSLVVSAILALPVVRIQARLRRANALLAKVDDVRAIGPLIESLHSSDRDTCQSAEWALRHLLPRLKATDANLLNERQRESLFRALAITHADFVLAALKALEQIGDEKAIEHVHRLVDGLGKAGKVPRVQKAAADCLAFLRVKAQRDQENRTLLRPATGADSEGTHLLRPAGSVPDVPPELLLRASSRDPGEDEAG